MASRRSPTRRSPTRHSPTRGGGTIPGSRTGGPTRTGGSVGEAEEDIGNTARFEQTLENVRQNLEDLEVYYDNKRGTKQVWKSRFHDLELALEVLPAEMRDAVMDRYAQYKEGARRRTRGVRSHVTKTPASQRGM